MGDLAVSRKRSAERVQDVLAGFGIDPEVREFPISTRTAQQAAEAIGCEVAQIAKSLIFRAAGGDAVLVIASGRNRVDEHKIAAALGEPIGKADAEFVRRTTGFAIGGVPPVGHLQPLRTLIDRTLFDYAELWAAAGTPNAVFRLPPATLRRITDGTVADIAAPAV